MVCCATLTSPCLLCAYLPSPSYCFEAKRGRKKAHAWLVCAAQPYANVYLLYCFVAQANPHPPSFVDQGRLLQFAMIYYFRNYATSLPGVRVSTIILHFRFWMQNGPRDALLVRLYNNTVTVWAPVRAFSWESFCVRVPWLLEDNTIFFASEAMPCLFRSIHPSAVCSFSLFRLLILLISNLL